MTREEAIERMKTMRREHATNPCPDRTAFDMAISALSENKEEDRPKGHWIEIGYVGNGNYMFECSECHHTDTQSKAVKVNYCWNCGADMRGE